MSLKDDVLKRLEESRGAYLSGEALSRELGVTRQAVWKAVKSLISDGYAVDSATNKGYMLDDKCDLLSASVIRGRTGTNVFCFDAVTSTNDVARLKFEQSGECIVVADSQTKGKKKNGERFHSPEQKGIYMSVALPIRLDITRSVELRSVIAGAVAECIGRACGVRPEAKNVDELYSDGKKVCGILVEAQVNLAALQTTGAVIGVGIYTADVGGALGYVDSSETRNALVSDIFLRLKDCLREF